MTFRRQTVAALVALPLVIALVGFLEFWIHAVKWDFSGDGPNIPHTWARLALHFCFCTLLVALVWLVLYRPPGALVATVYLVVGLYFSLAYPLVFSQVGPLFWDLPFSRFVLGGHETIQIIPPFYFVLGIAAFIRSYTGRRANA